MGAVIGATGGAAAAALGGVLGGGAVATAVTGAVSWGFASGVGQVTDNVLRGRQWHQVVLRAVGWGAVAGPVGRYGGRYLGRYLGRAAAASRGIFHRASGHIGRAAVRIVRITKAPKARAAAARAWLTSWRIRVAIHGPHHRFPLVGNVRHVSITIWRRGVKGSHRRVQIPIFWRRSRN